MNLFQSESVGEIERYAVVVRDVARLVAQVGDQVRAQMVGQDCDILHQSQHVAEHLFVVHVFGRERIGVVQSVEFDGIVQVALDEVAGG